MSHNERQHAYKAIAYVLKRGCAQPACRDDQSDTTTLPGRGAPSPASGSLVLKSGNTETIVKQMRLAAHMTMTCGTPFTDALTKMVERKQVIAPFTMRCLAEMQAENFWRVCNYMASPKSTWSAPPPRLPHTSR